jgi:hypothetical protein
MPSLLAIVAMVGAMATGCARLEFKSSGLIPISIASQQKHVKPASVEGHREFYFWGLLPREQSVLIDEELKDQGLISAAEVEVETFETWGSTIKEILSLGLYNPRHYRIRALGPKTLGDD